MVRKVMMACGVGAVAVMALWWSRHEPVAVRAQPNVLFVVWDTARADRMSLYGHPAATTPALERFAAGARVYDAATSPGMWTVPSHASMFTGLMPTTHGAGMRWRWLDGHHVTLAELLRDAGWETFAFSANPNLSEAGANLLQGFERIETSWGATWWPLVHRMTQAKLIAEDRSTEISPAYPDAADGNRYFNGAAAAERSFLAFLDDRPDPERPWFAYLNYMEPHRPRVPAQRFRKEVMTEEQRRLALETDLSFRTQLGVSVGALSLEEDAIDATRGVYDATIRELDFFFARLEHQLQRRGLADDTLVVLTSDHGESLGEHGRYGHRSGVYQTVVHVPLIVRYPGVVPPGREVTPVSTLDVFATVLDLVGVEAPAGVESRTLLPEPAQRDVFTEALAPDLGGAQQARRWFPDADVDPASGTPRAIRRGSWKLIRTASGATQLYDLAADPLETRNRANDEPVRVSQLTAALVEHWRDLPRYDRGARTDDDHPRADADGLRMLEMLGYVEPEGP